MTVVMDSGNRSVTPVDRLVVRKNLAEYCGQDTYVMFEILLKLESLARR